MISLQPSLGAALAVFPSSLLCSYKPVLPVLLMFCPCPENYHGLESWGCFAWKESLEGSNLEDCGDWQFRWVAIIGSWLALRRRIPPAELVFRGRALALRESTRARAAPVAMIVRRWSKSGALAQGVRAGVLIGGTSLRVSCISAHLAVRALNYLFKDV